VLSWHLGLWLVAAGAGLFLAGLVTAGLVLLGYRLFVQAVAQQVSRVTPLPVPAPVAMRTEDEKRTKAHWGVANAAEVILFEALKVVEAQQVAAAQTENFLLKAEWIRSGGNPDAKWPDIVRWKDRQSAEKENE
jgi:hypothetical protein